MDKMLWLTVMLASLIWASGLQAATNRTPIVTNVSAAQRTDGSNLVDIYYDLSDADGDACTVWAKVSNDGGSTWWIPANHVSGDVGQSVASGTRKHIVWDVGIDGPGLSGSNFKARVYADDNKMDAAYTAEMCLVAAGMSVTSTGTQVTLSAYCIDKYEVTNQFYCMFLNSGGKDLNYHTEMSAEIDRTGTAGNYTYKPKLGFKMRPARWVSWYDAVAFCDWRSIAEGKPAGTYRLPTEAEWEKAAGWDPVRQKLWTFAFQSDQINMSRANYQGSNLGTTTDVGIYDPWKSYYGCFDMTGNVWEWFSDWWGGTYPSSATNPTGPTGGTSKIAGGGSFTSPAWSWPVSGRSTISQESRWDELGFRSARTAQ